jgi:hypothetical protein
MTFLQSPLAVPIYIAVVYIFSRGLLSVLHQLTSILIRKMEE